MIVTDTDNPADSSSQQKRNFRLGVLNGTWVFLGMNASHPSLVLSIFVRALGGSNALVGALSTIRFGGWYLPQFLAAGYVQPRQRKVPVTVATESVRTLLYGVLAALTLAWGLSRPTLLLVTLLVLFSISRLLAGIGALARTDAIGKIIAPRRRVAFFAMRSFWGGLAAFGIGFLVRFILGDGRPWSFPSGFVILFGLSTVCFAIATLVFSRLREKPGPRGLPTISLGAQLRRAPGLLRADPFFRRYILLRALLSMSQLAAPFYPVLALDVLDAPASMVGIYMSALTISSVVSNLLWQRISRHRSNVFVVKVAALLTVLEPVSAIVLLVLLPLLTAATQSPPIYAAYAFSLVFLVSGTSASGRGIGLMASLLDLAPDEERASYVGLVNTLLGMVSLLTIAAGALIDRLGYAPVLAGTALLLVGGFVAALQWKEKEVPSANEALAA